MQTLRLAPYGVDEVRRGAELVREAEVARRAAHQPRGASISIRDLRKSFDGLDVLTGIDLEIPAGQFVAIVGRSGCGKSTLLRLLAGLETPDSGTIDFGDGELTARQGAYDSLRVMFQEPRLLPWSRVLSNVEVGLGRERRGADARERALAALKAVGLTEKGGQWPSILSGGQKQRVALARALVGHPRILAFDEPLGALDALTRISMQKLLGRVWREQGFTAVLVTHDVAEAIVLADRVLLIEHGRIALDLDVAIKRPRERGSAEVAALEGRILKALFRDARDGEDA